MSVANRDVKANRELGALNVTYIYAFKTGTVSMTSTTNRRVKIMPFVTTNSCLKFVTLTAFNPGVPNWVPLKKQLKF